MHHYLLKDVYIHAEHLFFFILGHNLSKISLAMNVVPNINANPFIVPIMIYDKVIYYTSLYTCDFFLKPLSKMPKHTQKLQAIDL